MSARPHSSWFTQALLVWAIAVLAACGSDPRQASEQSGPPPAPGEIGKGDSPHALDLIGPDPSGGATRYPIVLCHGLGASTERFGFRDVAGALEADGHIVVEGSVPPFQSVEVRAQALEAIVEGALAGSGALKVNIIAHSMGGLDARALITARGYGDRVATLTTIATPHRGSGAADAVLRAIGGLEDTDIIDNFAQAYATTFSEVAESTDVRAALTALSEAQAPAFNAAHPNDPRVVYQSVAGVSNVMGIPNSRDLATCDYTYYSRKSGKAAYPGAAGGADTMSATLVPLAHSTSHGTFEPNDGVVAVESAKWGIFLGCLPTDHLDIVGYGWRSSPSATTGWHHSRFYRNLAFDLAARGY